MTEPVRLSIVAPIVALACLLLPLPPWIFEAFYSRDLYPRLQEGVSRLSNLAPFAMLDALLLGVAALVIYRLWRVRLVIRQRGLMDALWEIFRRVVRAAAIVTILFLWVWGYNYRRLPLDSALAGGVAVRPTVAGLESAFAEAHSLALRLRPTVLVLPEMDYSTAAAELRVPIQTALALLGRARLATLAEPKHSVVLQPFFVRAGIDGMINPFGLESIVHRDLLPFERGFVLAHEWAHLAGEAGEAEASAVGWLACMNGGPQLAYSASIYLILQTQAAMPGDVRHAALGRIHPDIRRDLEAITQRLKLEHPSVQRTAERIYDEYLRANRVEDGTASYGRALSLILSQPLRDALRKYR